MVDHIIDTNVLVVANKRASHVLAEQQTRVLDWLMEFQKDGQRKIVLDTSYKIMKEYRRNMTEQDIGFLVVREKLQLLVRFMDVSYDNNGDGCLPAELEKVIHDPADRKFVAVALKDLSDGGQSTIINAVDTDWCDWEKALKRVGITVTHLIDGLCQDRHRSRAKKR